MGEDLANRFEVLFSELSADLQLLSNKEVLVKQNEEFEFKLRDREEVLSKEAIKLNLKEKALIDQAKYIHLKNAELTHKEEQIAIKQSHLADDEIAWQEKLKKLESEASLLEAKALKANLKLDELKVKEIDLQHREEAVRKDLEIDRVRKQILEDRERAAEVNEGRLQRVADHLRNKQIELDSKRGHLNTV
jgi:hypothetical protein